MRKALRTITEAVEEGAVEVGELEAPEVAPRATLVVSRPGSEIRFCSITRAPTDGMMMIPLGLGIEEAEEEAEEHLEGLAVVGEDRPEAVEARVEGNAWI